MYYCDGIWCPYGQHRIIGRVRPSDVGRFLLLDRFSWVMRGVAVQRGPWVVFGRPCCEEKDYAVFALRGCLQGKVWPSLFYCDGQSLSAPAPCCVALLSPVILSLYRIWDREGIRSRHYDRQSDQRARESLLAFSPGVELGFGPVDTTQQRLEYCYCV